MTKRHLCLLISLTKYSALEVAPEDKSAVAGPLAAAGEVRSLPLAAPGAAVKVELERTLSPMLTQWQLDLQAHPRRLDKRLLRVQRQLATYQLLIIDELGYVPLSPTGAELLFEVFSQRYERGSTIVTSNLPFDEWTGVFGSERLTGALLDRLTHHVHILEMNGDSYRLKQSKQRQRRT